MEFEIELVGDPTQAQPTSSDQAVDITGPRTAALPPRVVEERAHKANLGLGELSPGVDVLKAAIERGDEQYAREDSANSLKLKESDNRLAMLREFAGSKPAGSPITQDDADLVAGLTTEPVVDPATVWEKQYGTFLTNRLVANTDDPDGAVNKGIVDEPAETFLKLDVARDLIAKNEVVNKRAAELEATWKDMGFWDTAGTVIGTVVPGRTSLNQTNTALFSKDAIGAIALPGSTLGEQIKGLVSIPDPETFAARFNETVDRIADSNVLDAIDFIAAVKGMSASEQLLKNVIGVADIADITGLTGALAKGLVKAGTKIGAKTLTKSGAEALKAVDDTVRASLGKQEPSIVAGRIGMTNESAELKVIAKHTGETTQGIPLANTRDKVDILIDQMPTFSKPGDIFDGSASLSNAQATRIGTMLENNAAKFLDILPNTIVPERLTPEALSRAIRNAKIEMKREFNHLNDAVLDVVRNPVDPFTNTHSVSIRLGTPTAETFTSSSQAHLFARDIYNLPEGSYNVGQQGTSFYVDVTKPIKETQANVQEMMVTTNNSSPIPNMAAALIQGVRTPAELFSALQKSNRDASLLGQTNFGSFLSEVAAPIGALKKSQRKDLQRVMDQNRDYIDPVSGDRGRYHETVVDLEQGYLDTLNRLPTEGEVSAYYAAVQINEMDWALRNFTAYRDLSRQGIEEFQVRVGTSGYSEYSVPKYTTTPKFKAREREGGIPWGDDDMLPVAVLDESGTGAQVVYRSSPQEQRAMIQDLLDNRGYKVIQVARPQERVLKDTAGIKDPVQYIVTKGHTKSPLDFHQVDRSPGFHVEYADPYYIKQPRVSILEGGSRAYEGDATLWSFQTKAQGVKFEKRVNELREAIKRGEANLDPYITGKLPEDANWWKRQFAEDGFFNLDQPFRIVARGDNVRNMDPAIKQLRDLTDEQTTLTSGMDKKFQGERSQQLLSPVEGTEENPLVKLKQSPMIDSLTATSRGIGQASRSRWFGDMKISVAEQFVKEFGDLLDATPQELAKFPMFYLHNPPWRAGTQEVQRLAAAKAIQKTTMEFVGQQSPFGKHLQMLEAKVMDGVYNSAGQGVVEKLRTAQDFINSRDPMAYFRAWAFRAKMGFFNVQQIAVQAQGLFHITAIAPQHAAQSLAAYTFTRAMSLNSSPEIVKGAAQKLAKMGWKPEHFEESFNLMQRTGWQNVGKEATFIDDMSDPKLYEGQVGKWLDKSAIFFKETEEMIRTVGWHAAYREWRTANPTKTVTNREMGQILSRADTMTLNMTNASKASWERGVLSIPAQFQSYGVRLFEQMWGGQLSTAEKARVLGLNSILYGIPVGLSGPLAYPLYEDIRAYALENGLTVNDTFIQSLIEGIPQLIISTLGGGDVNYGQRYGPGGISLIKDLISEDKTFTEAMLGPSGSVYKDIFFNAAPAGTVAIAKMLTGESYEPEVQDLIDAARTITTVNAADRVYMAATIGKYISRKGTVLSDSTTMEAIVSAVTGTQAREFSDAMIMNKSTKDFEANKREIAQEAQKHIGRALVEAANGNQQSAEAYMTKARAQIILGDFTAAEKTTLFTRVVGGKNSTLVDKFRRDWVMKAPASKRLDRAKQMETTD